METLGAPEPSIILPLALLFFGAKNYPRLVKIWGQRFAVSKRV